MRAPVILALAATMALLILRSSFAPYFTADASVWLVFAILTLGSLATLLPAWFTRGSPIPLAGISLVAALTVGTYGASRLDWLRVLKDFDVQEEAPLDALRVALGALALLLLWLLHTLDLAARFRLHATTRGITPSEATRAARRTLRRNAEAAGITILAALGLTVIVLLGLRAGEWLPVNRAALAAPLLAAALLTGASVWIAARRA